MLEDKVKKVEKIVNIIPYTYLRVIYNMSDEDSRHYKFTYLQPITIA
jgi:hypothetical protein